jgi:hypothetical protein
MRHAIGVPGAKLAYRIQMFKQATCNLARWLSEEGEDQRQVGRQAYGDLEEAEATSAHVNGRWHKGTGCRVPVLLNKIITLKQPRHLVRC